MLWQDPSHWASLSSDHYKKVGTHRTAYSWEWARNRIDFGPWIPELNSSKKNEGSGLGQKVEALQLIGDLSAWFQVQTATSARILPNKMAE